ncbi:MAG: ATPase, T2SS/T4P/T4SS family [Candidatus Woesearchaeota archaeon]
MFEQYFQEGVLSVHLYANERVFAKKGTPGNIQLVQITQEPLSVEKITQIIESILANEKATVYAQNDCAQIVELQAYRIVIVSPPLVSRHEVTIVCHKYQRELSEYAVPFKLQTILSQKSRGILIGGSPGAGKSTLSQALALHYHKQNTIIKTIENPRDMILPLSITQYAKAFSTVQQLKDIVLLSRPDYVFFDEMRNTEDFTLFSDLRLSGTGMIGVVHATNAVDALHRFVGKTEIGLLPHIIDTILFVDKGEIATILTLSMVVKVPTGMHDKSISRPVIEVRDLVEQTLLYELYTFGDQLVLMPVKEDAQTILEQYFKKKQVQVRIEKVKDVLQVLVSEDQIATLAKDQDLKKLIDTHKLPVRFLCKQESTQNALSFDVKKNPQSITMELNKKYAQCAVEIYIEHELLFRCKASKSASLKIRTDSEVGHKLVQALEYGQQVQVFSAHE